MPARVPSLELAKIERADRSELVDIAGRYREMQNAWIRKMVIEHGRVDVLARAVLGLTPQPFHIAMLRHQAMHQKSLVLAFRGAGKTSSTTIPRVITCILRDPNVRILIASKSTSNAEAMLKEVKGHLTGNERLIEIFGAQYSERKVGKWDTREIEVAGRTRNAKEATVTVAGVDGTIVSKHYDAIFSDDLVDEENSRTQLMRSKTRTWYYQTLDPCLEPPDPAFPDRGQHHHAGTRYHYDDLWGQLMEGELKGKTLIIPALDEAERSPWPEKYPPEWFRRKREDAGTIIFSCQYLCSTEAMKGEIIQYDDCQIIDDDEIPENLAHFTGVDLAIGQEEINDKTATCTIKFDRVTGNIYVIDFWEGQLRFGKQTDKILEVYDRHDPVRCLVEAVGYQAAQVATVKEKRPGIRVFGVDVKEDKVIRAQKLSALFEQKKVFFRRGMQKLIEQLVLLPSTVHDDGFDALDLAVRATRLRKRRARAEPGVI